MPMSLPKDDYGARVREMMARLREHPAVDPVGAASSLEDAQALGEAVNAPLPQSVDGVPASKLLQPVIGQRWRRSPLTGEMGWDVSKPEPKVTRRVGGVHWGGGRSASSPTGG